MMPSSSSSILAILLGILLACAATGQSSGSNGDSLLMIGNSFTYANDLEQMVGKMLEEGTESAVLTKRIARGAAQLHQYAENPKVQQTIAERPWSFVVLQEQSQLPGLYQTAYDYQYQGSLEAAGALNEWIVQDGAETVLLMTWGMRTADPMNPSLYRDFEVMQHRLTHGYEEMQQKLSTPARPVRVAPAGLAFSAIKKVADSDAVVSFDKLYSSDSKHPSKYGSYLVACTVYATLTGKDPRATRYRPDDIPEEDQRFLQTIAAETVTAYNVQNTLNADSLAKSQYVANLPSDLADTRQTALEEVPITPTPEKMESPVQMPSSTASAQDGLDTHPKKPRTKRRVLESLLSFLLVVLVVGMAVLRRQADGRLIHPTAGSKKKTSSHNSYLYDELSVTENSFTEVSGDGDYEDLELTVQDMVGDLELEEDLNDVPL